MNPSIYPITVANWNHIRLVLPELNKTFFTITINRGLQTGDFSWSNDRPLLNKLRSLGMITYAGMFKNVPPTEKAEEINFGSIYLGQTLRLHHGKYNFSGFWGGEEGSSGQLSIYAGFGDNFPHLAYYLSMALVKPDIMESASENSLSKVEILEDALLLNTTERRLIFSALQNHIETDERLNRAFEAGKQITDLLNP